MKGRFITLFLASLVGLAASIWMTQSHLRLVTTGFEEKSFCNLSDFVDCDTALASRYSKIAGIPTSELGIAYYALVATGLLVAAASLASRQATLSFLFLSSILAVAYSAVMAYLSIGRLGVLCLLCLATYVANLLTLVILPGMLGVPFREVPSYVVRYLRACFKAEEALRPRLVAHLAATVVVFGVGLLFLKGLNPEVHRAHAGPKFLPAQYLKAYQALPVRELSVGDLSSLGGLGDRPSWGPPDAKVTIVEFSDFQCPFCRRAAFTLKPYLGEFRKEIRFVFVNYPLDSACNPAITRPLHPVACLAAKGALCAHRERKFWEYHDRVFENQKKLSRSTLVKIAGELGLEEGPFNECLVSPEIEKALAEEMALGRQAEIEGTPAIFINGRYFRDWVSPERLRAVLKAEVEAR